MNLLIEVIKKQGCGGKKLIHFEFTAFEEHVWQTADRDSANYTKRFVLFSYLDFRFCFACYPPESFKIICLMCVCRHSSIQAFILRETRDEMLRSTATSFVCFKKGSLGKTQNSAGAGTKFGQSIVTQILGNFFRGTQRLFSVK